MATWGQEVKKIMKASNMVIYMFVGYVDDIRILMNMLENGQTWCEENRSFKIIETEKLPEDEWNRQARIDRTRVQMARMFSSIFKSLKFTTETPEDFTNLRLPTLDTELWLNNDGTIKYSFFRKTISTEHHIKEHKL